MLTATLMCCGASACGPNINDIGPSDEARQSAIAEIQAATDSHWAELSEAQRNSWKIPYGDCWMYRNLGEAFLRRWYDDAQRKLWKFPWLTDPQYQAAWDAGLAEDEAVSVAMERHIHNVKLYCG